MIVLLQELPLPLGEGWGEGGHIKHSTASCYAFNRYPSIETASLLRPLPARQALPRHGLNRMVTPGPQIDLIFSPQRNI